MMGGWLRRGETKSCGNRDFGSKSRKGGKMAEWRRKNAQNRAVCDVDEVSSGLTFGAR